MSSDGDSPKSWVASFWEHADELVRRFKVVLVALILTTSIGWLPTSLSGIMNMSAGGYQPLLSIVMQRIKHDFLPHQATLIAGGMADTVYVYAYLSVVAGILLSSPVIMYEVYAFVKPALYENEKKFLLSYIGSFIGLLALGAAMAYFLIIPISFRILIYFTISGGATPFIFIKDFYSWILTLFTICGIFYTVPLFLVLLVQIGILPIRFLRGRNKIIVYVVILMVFWIFGPDPTPITGAIMMAPFVIVFESATFFARRIDRTRQQKRKESSGTYGKPSPHFGLFPTRSCRYCHSEVDESKSSFCPQCNRSIR